MSKAASLVGPARERAARGDVAVHDHLCGIYDTREEQYKAACRFLGLGLERKEQCFYIAEQLSPAEFVDVLKGHGVDAEPAIKSGALLILSGETLRRELGGFTPDAMLSFLERFDKKALARGFPAWRWAADMTWLRSDGIEPGDLFVFEAQLNGFMASHNASAFCQYAMDDFKAELMIASLETHPLVVYNDLVCDNFYYIPPEEFLKPRFAEMKLRRILINIISRERLMQTFLSTTE